MSTLLTDNKALEDDSVDTKVELLAEGPVPMVESCPAEAVDDSTVELTAMVDAPSGEDVVLWDRFRVSDSVEPVAEDAALLIEDTGLVDETSVSGVKPLELEPGAPDDELRDASVLVPVEDGEPTSSASAGRMAAAVPGS